MQTRVNIANKMQQNPSPGTKLRIQKPLWGSPKWALALRPHLGQWWRWCIQRQMVAGVQVRVDQGQPRHSSAELCTLLTEASAPLPKGLALWDQG